MTFSRDVVHRTRNTRLNFDDVSDSIRNTAAVAGYCHQKGGFSLAVSGIPMLLFIKMASCLYTALLREVNDVFYA